MRLHTTWKVQSLFAMMFAIMEADRAAAYNLSGMQVAIEAGCYMMFGLLPVLAITFTTELHARAQYCKRHRLSNESVGTFWIQSFSAASKLGMAHPPLDHAHS